MIGAKCAYCHVGYFQEDGTCILCDTHMTVYPEGSVPDHKHILGWDWDQDLAGAMGIECRFRYFIPPGPKGKRPRVRYCGRYLSLEEILDMVEGLV